MKLINWLLTMQPSDTDADLEARLRERQEPYSVFAPRWLEPRSMGAEEHRHAVTVRKDTDELSYATVGFVFATLGGARRYAKRLASWLTESGFVGANLHHGRPISTARPEQGELIDFWTWSITGGQVLQLSVRQQEHGRGRVYASTYFEPAANYWEPMNEADISWQGWERCQRLQHYPFARVNEPTMDEILASIRRIIAEDGHLQAT